MVSELSVEGVDNNDDDDSTPDSIAEKRGVHEVTASSPCVAVLVRGAAAFDSGPAPAQNTGV
jgi:hypothetical protein